jgi:hypothetical protein
MKEWKFTKPLLSSYYIAAIFSFFLFQLTKPMVISVTSWVISFLGEFFGIKLIGNGPTWTALFFVCLFFTTIIRRIVVEPLELYVTKEANDLWEVWILGFLVLGFYIYTLNLVFDSTPMPSDWWPEWLIRILGGFENTYITPGLQTVSQRNAWVVIPWIWLLGPIFFLYIKTVTVKKAD